MPARFSQGRACPQAMRPRTAAASHAILVDMRAPTSRATQLAAGACNALGMPLSGQLRRGIFRVSPAGWFAVCSCIKRSSEGISRILGMTFIHRVRNVRGWPLPRASIQGTLPWTPCLSKRALLRQLLTRRSLHMLVVEALYYLFQLCASSGCVYRSDQRPLYVPCFALRLNSIAVLMYSRRVSVTGTQICRVCHLPTGVYPAFKP